MATHTTLRPPLHNEPEDPKKRSHSAEDDDFAEFGLDDDFDAIEEDEEEEDYFSNEDEEEED